MEGHTQEAVWPRMWSSIHSWDHCQSDPSRVLLLVSHPMPKAKAAETSPWGVLLLPCGGQTCGARESFKVELRTKALVLLGVVIDVCL